MLFISGLFLSWKVFRFRVGIVVLVMFFFCVCSLFSWYLMMMIVVFKCGCWYWLLGSLWIDGFWGINGGGVGRLFILLCVCRCGCLVWILIYFGWDFYECSNWVVGLVLIVCVLCLVMLGWNWCVSCFLFVRFGVGCLGWRFSGWWNWVGSYGWLVCLGCVGVDGV